MKEETHDKCYTQKVLYTQDGTDDDVICKKSNQDDAILRKGLRMIVYVRKTQDDVISKKGLRMMLYLGKDPG